MRDSEPISTTQELYLGIITDFFYENISSTVLSDKNPAGIV